MKPDHEAHLLPNGVRFLRSFFMSSWRTFCCSVFVPRADEVTDCVSASEGTLSRNARNALLFVARSASLSSSRSASSAVVVLRGSPCNDISTTSKRKSGCEANERTRLTMFLGHISIQVDVFDVGESGGSWCFACGSFLGVLFVFIIFFIVLVLVLAFLGLVYVLIFGSLPIVIFVVFPLLLILLVVIVLLLQICFTLTRLPPGLVLSLDEISELLVLRLVESACVKLQIQRNLSLCV
eukprot:m.104205 g.104205  ORF g.104205 m.104205 type:complete len:238 (-) comp51586_c0_seq7:956-1669(-)